jgi:hypothetical protein
MHCVMRVSIAPSSPRIAVDLSPRSILWEDKGMLKGRLYNWEDMARMGRQSPGTRSGRKLACRLSVCMKKLSLIDAQKTVPAPIKG